MVDEKCRAGGGANNFRGDIIGTEKKGGGSRTVLHFLDARRPRARPFRPDNQDGMLSRLECRGQCGYASALRTAEIHGPDRVLQTQGDRNNRAGLQVRGWGGGGGEINLANLRSIPAPEALPC